MVSAPALFRRMHICFNFFLFFKERLGLERPIALEDSNRITLPVTGGRGNRERRGGDIVKVMGDEEREKGRGV